MPAGTGTSSTASVPALPAKLPAVLIVDDHRTMLKILEQQLRQLGFTEVDAFSEPREALRALGTKSYGLVLSDWNMAGMSGLELLKAVRSFEPWRGLPFVLITAENSPANVQAAKEAGVTGYIVKPFDAEGLKRRLAAILAQPAMGAGPLPSPPNIPLTNAG